MGWWRPSFARNGHGARDQEAAALDASRHHGELARVDELVEPFDFLGQAWVFFVLGRVGVGGLAAGFGVGEGVLLRHGEGG